MLILLYPDEAGEAHLILTERASGGHRHAGQISLPGGAIDETDASPTAAALREAREEVGLDPEQAGVGWSVSCPSSTSASRASWSIP